MQIFWYVFIIVIGLVIASFLNVCADRLPTDKSIVKPPSHCDSCNRRLSAKDLIPIFSYLFAAGKCRYCGARISIRVLLVEIGTGIIFGLLFWRFGLSPAFGIGALYSCIFILILVTDYEHGLILNKVIYPSLIIALVITLVMSAVFSAWQITINSLIGGAGGFVLFFLIVIISRGGMGFGDVKMAALIGLALGWQSGLVGILIGILLGGIVAIVLLILKMKGRKQAIPFGPFLSIGAIIALFYGSVIWQWYSNILAIG
ncbi:MAG: prepilin peptidase [Dehalococcoidales bacterium]|nr:prepilin peptidase [Dehalococcoidales bacterium]